MTNGLILHGLAIDFTYFVANMQSRLPMNHAAVHDSCDDTSTIFSHFQGDAHRFVCILLELNKSDARDVLKFASIVGDVVDFVATVEIRAERRGCDAERFIAVDFSCNHVMRVQQSLWKIEGISDWWQLMDRNRIDD